MNAKIPYLRWRERINDIVPDEYRIGTDVLVVPQHRLFDVPEGYFKIDVTTILIYDKGEVRVSLDMRDYHIKAPAALTILPNSTFCYLDHSEDLEYKAVIMSESFTDNLFQNIDRMHPLRDSVLNHPVQEGSEVIFIYNHYVRMLVDLLKGSSTNYKLEAVKHLTLAMFYAYSSARHALMSERIGRKDELYGQFTDLVRRHFRTCRDVNYYAELLCITVKYLSQVVKEQTGRPASEVIEQYVITECKALLSSTTMSIQQIADTLNFPSQSVFGKYFKRATGMSPREYRNRG